MFFYVIPHKYICKECKQGIDFVRRGKKEYVIKNEDAFDKLLIKVFYIKAIDIFST